MSKPSEWGKPPFRYEMVGDSDGEQWGYDHMVYDADGQELCNAPNERVGRLWAAAPDILASLIEAERCLEAYISPDVWDGHTARIFRTMREAIRKATGTN